MSKESTGLADFPFVFNRLRFWAIWHGDRLMFPPEWAPTRGTLGRALCMHRHQRGQRVGTVCISLVLLFNNVASV